MNKQWLKIAGLTLAISCFGFFAKAQTTTPVKQSVIKNSDAATGVTSNGNVTTSTIGAVRLVDNKGTVKYLQVQNGITAVTDATTNPGGVTTTWQLGGYFTNDTYLNINGKVFGLDSLKLIAPATSPAATAAVDQNSHLVPGTPTGWTVLVRDEQTGAIEKILVSDLIDAGRCILQVTAASTAALDLSTLTGYPSPNTLPANIGKISVYRNGVKLIAGTSATGSDYFLSSTTVGSVKVSVTPNGFGATDPDEWSLYAGDRIEIQWIK